MVEQETNRIVVERRGFRADQFLKMSNFRAHYLHTGPEILEQAGGRIDASCDFVGSEGTFAGCAACLKEHDPSIQCFIVEPAGCAVLAGNPASNPHHRIQGGGYSAVALKMFNGSTSTDSFK